MQTSARTCVYYIYTKNLVDDALSVLVVCMWVG